MENGKIQKQNSDFCKRVCSNFDIKNLVFDDKIYERVLSQNHEHFNPSLITNAQKIIVGTLTPPQGTQFGYFYSSLNNKVYGILDKCFLTNGKLVALKKQLAKDNQNQKIIKQIEEQLFVHKVAFLDIVDTAIRVKNSSKDDDIIAYSLDFEHFELCNNSQVFICTSQNAYKGLMKIIENPKVNIDKSKIFICYQDRFHYNFLDWQQKLC